MKDKILWLLGKFKEGSSKNYWIDLGELSTKTIDELKLRLGIDLNEYVRVVDVSAIKHILKKHGNPKVEKLRDQIAVEPDDFLKLPELFENFDCVLDSQRTKGGLVGVKYLKRDGVEWVYIEEIRTGRKKLALKTLYKKPLNQ